MANRSSLRQGDKMNYGFWLVFKKDGGLRMTRTQPDIDRTERAMSVQLTVPLSMFDTPTLRATIAVEGADLAPPVIDVQAAQAALKGALGCDVDLIVLEARE